MRKLLILILFTTCPYYAGAADFSSDSRGTTGAQFLELPAGARSIAMGSAYCSISGDPFSAYYNPAGLASMDRFNAGLMHAIYFQDITYEYGVVAAPVKDLGVLGLSAQYLSVNSLEEIDKTGVLTGDSFKPNDMALSVIYAKRFAAFDFGVSAKYIKSQILNSASTFAGDIGLQTRIGDYAFGLSVLNVGKGLKFLDEESSLPTTGRLGVSAHLTPNWLFSLDAIAPKGTSPLVAAGTEYKLLSNESTQMLLRAGYNSRTAASKLGGVSGINAGAGLDFGNTSVDYAWSLYGDLGSTHRFSLNLRLGGGRSERTDYRAKISDQELEQEAQALEPVSPPLAPTEAAADVPEWEKAYQAFTASADSYVEDKDYLSAAKEYASALKTLPENDSRRIFIFEREGQTALKLKNIQKAKDYYLASIKISNKLNFPETIVINSYLGLAYCFEQSGNITPAIRNYEKALELSSNTTTKARIWRILDKLGSKDDLLDTDTQGSNQSILTNAKILALAKSGTSDATIISLISQSPTGFDISLTALADLHDAGISGAVIAAMKRNPRTEDNQN